MIPHNKPTLGIEEVRVAEKIIKSGWLVQGKEVESFESDFCSYLCLPEGHAVALSSGTAALFLALWALKAKNKRIAIPAYSCSSLRHAVAMIEGNEILIDSFSKSPNIDLNSHDYKSCEIGIVPHMFGIPTDLSAYKDTLIIEDCAQALGSYVNNIPCGLQGDIGVYSFYATKLITSGGQGGMIVSKDKTLVDEIRDYRQFDCRKDNKKRFNFQMTDLQAGIGRAQLKKLPDFLVKRKKIFEKYNSALPMLCNNENSNIHSVYFRAIYKTDRPLEIIEQLEKEKIKAILPIEEWELLGEQTLFPNAYRFTQNTVSLPIYPLLEDKDVDSILNVIEKFSDS